MTGEESGEIGGADADDACAVRVAEDPLPTAASTTRRATAAWWVLFTGPVIIALALAIAGVVADRGAVILVFTTAVWAFTLMLGFAATPRTKSASWWLVPLGVSFVSGA